MARVERDLFRDPVKDDVMGINYKFIMWGNARTGKELAAHVRRIGLNRWATRADHEIEVNLKPSKTNE